MPDIPFSEFCDSQIKLFEKKRRTAPRPKDFDKIIETYRKEKARALNNARQTSIKSYSLKK